MIIKLCVLMLRYIIREENELFTDQELQILIATKTILKRARDE